MAVSVLCISGAVCLFLCYACVISWSYSQGLFYLVVLHSDVGGRYDGTKLTIPHCSKKPNINLTETWYYLKIKKNYKIYVIIIVEAPGSRNVKNKHFNMTPFKQNFHLFYLIVHSICCMKQDITLNLSLANVLVIVCLVRYSNFSWKLKYVIKSF